MRKMKIAESKEPLTRTAFDTALGYSVEPKSPGNASIKSLWKQGYTAKNYERVLPKNLEAVSNSVLGRVEYYNKYYENEKNRGGRRTRRKRNHRKTKSRRSRK